MPTGVYERTPAHRKALRENALRSTKKRMAGRKKRKYVRRAAALPEGLDGISVSGAIVLLRKAKKAMTMDDLAEKDLYVLLALQELQGSI